MVKLDVKTKSASGVVRVFLCRRSSTSDYSLLLLLFNAAFSHSSVFKTSLSLTIPADGRFSHLPLQEFKTSGSSNTDTSKVAGTLETKYKRSEYGLTFTEKWNTDNTLGTEITIEDQVRKKN